MGMSDKRRTMLPIKLRAENFIQHFQNPLDTWICATVVHCLGITAGRHQTVRPKPSEML